MLLTPRRSTSRTHDVFVTSRAFKRLTLPRYALLDHVAVRRGAAATVQWVSPSRTRGGPISQWRRCSTARARSLPHSRGPFWKAVRASGSLPAVLPPVFTDDGRMLVDGGVVENIPLRSMKTVKTGPNLVVHFGVRDSSSVSRWIHEHSRALAAGSPTAHSGRPAPLPAHPQSHCRAAAVPGNTRIPSCCPSARLILF